MQTPRYALEWCFLLCISFLSGWFVLYPVSARGQDHTTQQVFFDDGSHLEGPEMYIRVNRTTQPITIDGDLSDSAWQQADPYEGHFFQQEPEDRKPSSQKTRIMVLQDDKNLYFGMQAYYDDPDRIFASSMRRDVGFGTDDILELLIGPLGDNRTSYTFSNTPLGGKIDAIISDEGNHINSSWDGVWYSKAQINDQGFAVEMAIPFKTLKYRVGETVRWKLNVTREIKYKNEVTYLVPIPRGLGHNGKFRGSLHANLVNIHPPQTGLNLEVQPYLRTAGSRIYDPVDERNTDFHGGLDARYQVTPQLTADFTYNTDFAQVETDQEIVNLTRFNINLPEKREFFLESAGLFTFGTGARAGGSLVGIHTGSDYLLFNSRTIGIEQGERVPLYGGAKVTGRAGQFSVGGMNLQSKETRLRDGTLVPSTNYTAVKVKRDLFTNSNIGLMMLNKQSGPGHYNRAVGTDAFFAFSQAFMVNGSLARTLSPDVSGNNWAGDAGLVVNTEWLDFSLKHSFIDSLFNPEMGFVRRGNLRNTQGDLSLTKWINNRYLKSVSFITGIQYITDHRNTLLTRENDFELWVTARSEDNLRLETDLEYEYLPTQDYIRDIPIDPGIYKTHTSRVSVNTYRSRRVTGSIEYEWGPMFDGTSRGITLSNDTRVNRHFTLELEYGHNVLDLKYGSLTANILATRLNYSFTNDLFAKAFVQWNDADHRVSTYFLVDYIYRPKSHVYLVYQDTRNTLLSGFSNYRDRIIQLKFTYLWSI